MHIDEVRLHTIELPLVSPFVTSFGRQTRREALIVEVHATTADQTSTVGWGECVALSDPVYSAEYLDGARDVITRYLVPSLRAEAERADRAEALALSAERVAGVWRPWVGQRMAKAAVEMAVLDAQLRAEGRSFASYLGAEVDRVPSGVSVGIQDSAEQTVEVVRGYLDEGYVRIKLKIAPGADVDRVRAVREAIGDDVWFQVDANAAYSLLDAPLLARMDDLGLLLIEQPLGEEDLRQHAELARRLRTPVCLDESITSAQTAADAIMLGSAAVINIKPGRVGGYLEARRIHDLARAHGIAVWCGGMLETGLGRAANAALAALPGFTLPGDISASGRFYAEDITRPFVIEDGHIAVPDGPGLGVEPLPGALEEFGTRTDVV